MQKVSGVLLNDPEVFVGRFESLKEQEAELGAKTKEFANICIENLGEEVG
jgi:hypothetical protein